MTSLTNNQNSDNPSDIKSLFTDYLKGLKKTIHYAVIISFLIVGFILFGDGTVTEADLGEFEYLEWDTDKAHPYQVYITRDIEISDLLKIFSLESIQISLFFWPHYLWIYLLYFISIRYKKKDERLNLLKEKIMPENSVLRNSIRRFSEIRKIDSGNWMLIFILLFSAGYLGAILEGEDDWAEGVIVGIGTLLGLRLILLLCYFFLKFTNTRFNIITIILIVITIYAAVDAL